MNNLEENKIETRKNTITIEEENGFTMRLLGKESSLGSMPDPIDRPPVRRLGKEADMGSMPLQIERPPSSSEDGMAHSSDDTGMIDIVIIATP